MESQFRRAIAALASLASFVFPGLAPAQRPAGAPAQPRLGTRGAPILERQGSLVFRDGDPAYDAFKRVSSAVPTVVTVYLDRPAILTPLKGRARALLANFGVSDEALIDVLAGRARPEGKLPFELPASMTAVESQRSDVPYDSARPLYPFGFGRRY